MRSGGAWEEQEGFIEDETLSGKKRRRIAHSMAKRIFSVTMRFPLEEYENFHDWFVESTRKGFYPFSYPKIDSVFDKENLATYQFAKGGSPKYSNPAGDLIEVSMVWEEV